MLGLRYGTVRLVAYRPEWARAFVEERARLSEALSGLTCEIEHVGSTAVPGLLAKPILDIAVGLFHASSVEEAVSAIRGLSYQYQCDAGSEGGHVLVREAEPLVRTHHVHVVELGDPQWEAYLLFRDFLREHRHAREAYGAEKVALAHRHSGDREAYTEAKDGIVRELLAEARRFGGRCS
jgi:GrpB-like predicted nucleotidyltransferase (UPF0157 family)